MIPFLTLSYLPTVSGYWSLGKLMAVALGGFWLSFNSYRRDDSAMLGYLAIVLFSAVISTDPCTSLIGLHGTYNTGALCAVVLAPYWLGVSSSYRPTLQKQVRFCSWLLAVSAALQLNGYFVGGGLPTGERVTGTMGSPVYLGALCALFWPLCGWRERVLLAGTLLATGSRGAWFAVAAAEVYERWPWWSPRKRLWAVVLAGAGMCAALTLRPPSDLGRVVTWAAAWEAFKAKPLFGWGVGNFYTVAEVFRNPAWVEAFGGTTQDHAHNLFLEAMATSGVIGLIALCILLYALWRYSDRTARSSLVAVGVVGFLNPLPMVVKAVALMVVASSEHERLNIFDSEKSPKARMAFALSIACGVICFWLVSLDRRVTNHGKYPWSFSSMEAAYDMGFLRFEKTRRDFKL